MGPAVPRGHPGDGRGEGRHPLLHGALHHLHRIAFGVRAADRPSGLLPQSLYQLLFLLRAALGGFLPGQERHLALRRGRLLLFRQLAHLYLRGDGLLQGERRNGHVRDHRPAGAADTAAELHSGRAERVLRQVLGVSADAGFLRDRGGVSELCVLVPEEEGKERGRIEVGGERGDGGSEEGGGGEGSGEGE